MQRLKFWKLKPFKKKYDNSPMYRKDAYSCCKLYDIKKASTIQTILGEILQKEKKTL